MSQELGVLSNQVPPVGPHRVSGGQAIKALAPRCSSASQILSVSCRAPPDPGLQPCAPARTRTSATSRNGPRATAAGPVATAAVADPVATGAADLAATAAVADLDARGAADLVATAADPVATGAVADLDAVGPADLAAMEAVADLAAVGPVDPVATAADLAAVEAVADPVAMGAADPVATGPAEDPAMEISRSASSKSTKCPQISDGPITPACG
ncbi:PREDICTED: coiled-coil domain-containing protein 8 homolog [Ficedula albicollis]|uniref:coiled-coil domain-containing protein 8 homolog n=1 Tax=Ficedula albicollis TaxID=59894 RepID=UPI0007AD79E0|nr:PREDICTED: coiled-coil domain-containing protein 8 homolog [Ficedula albicollis]